MRLRQPTLIAPMGIPGAGKTTLAISLAGCLSGLQLVSRDEIRAAMFEPCFYSSREKDAAFGALLVAVDVILERGDSVVTDGMCLSDHKALQDLSWAAQRRGAAFCPLFCWIPEAMAISRVERDRAERRHMAADRDEALVRRVAASFRRAPRGIARIEMAQRVEKIAEDVLSVLHTQGLLDTASDE